MGGELTHVPVRISTEWLAKTVTTDPPRYEAHTEWSLAVTLLAPVPINAAVFLTGRQGASWGLRPHPASQQVELRAGFFPHDWAVSDQVQVNWARRRWTVTDPVLRRDPREAVTVTAPDVIQTGEIFEVAELPADGIRLEALAVAEADTEGRRNDRWRIRREFVAALPDRLVVLTSGRQSGEVRD